MLVSLQSALNLLNKDSSGHLLKVIKSEGNARIVKLLKIPKENLDEKTHEPTMEASAFKIEQALNHDKLNFYVDMKNVKLEDGAFYKACHGSDSTKINELFFQEDKEIVESVISKHLFTWAQQNHSVNFFRTLFTLRKEYVEDVDYNGSSLLHIACEKQSKELATYLVDLSLDLLTEENDYGEIPLHVACEKGSLEIISLLYERNPSLVFKKSEDGETPFQICCKHGHLESARWLLEKEPTLLDELLRVTENGLNCFENACLDQFLNISEWILGLKPDCIHAKDADNNSILHLICHDDSLETAKWLVEKNEDLLHQKNAFGQNVLHRAVFYNSTKISSWLCENHPFLMYEKDSKGHTPFRSLFEKGDKLSVLKIFVENDYIPESKEEFRLFLNLIHELSADEFRDLEPYLKKTTLGLYLASDSSLRTFLLNFAKDLKIELSHNFTFTSKLASVPKGRKLIEFYTQKIPDVAEITHPFADLISLFESLNSSLFASAAEGEKRSYDELKKDKMDEAKNLLLKLHHNQQDPAVPKGEEKFYYLHLHYIAKHLLRYLETHSQKESEALTFLEDIIDSSGTCFANFSAKFYSIYQRISPSQELAEAIDYTLSPDKQFLQTFYDFASQEIKSFTSRYLLDNDAHECAIWHEFLQKHAIPHLAISPISDLAFQRTYRIEVMASRLRLPMHPTETLEQRLEEHLIRFVKMKIHSPFFLENCLRKHLHAGINGAEPGAFLEQLSSWCANHNITIHEILKWDDIRNKYFYAPNGIFKLLKTLPNQLEINWS